MLRVVCCWLCVLCVAKEGWKYGVVSCDMERQYDQVLHEKDVSRDLNV